MRARKPKYSVYDMYQFSGSDSESEKEEVKKKKAKGRRRRKDDDEFSLRDNGDADDYLPYKAHKPPPRKSSKSKPTMSGPILFCNKFGSYDIPEGADYDPKRSPIDKPCRVVHLSEIKNDILNPKKYLKEGEVGINVILPKLDPSDPEKLKYFGLKSELVETSLEVIAKMSNAEIERELEKVEKELELCQTDMPNNLETVPAFDESMKNTITFNADVRYFDFKRLGQYTNFDVITMDPPWQIAFSSVTRGVAIRYDQMDVSIIEEIPVRHIQSDGYIFMWVIASQFANGISMLNKWGYEFVTYINWTKTSKYGRYMPSHGYYLQHNKETCLVGRKGRDPEGMRHEFFDDLIVSPRTLRQSHKPVDIYHMIEAIFPNSMYIEIFARPHNLREGWASMGIELPN